MTITPNDFLNYRKKHDLTQEQLADLLGITGKYVGMIERGDKDVKEDSSLGILTGVVFSGPPAKRFSSAATTLADNQGNYVARPKRMDRLIPVLGWAHAGDAVCYDEVPPSWQDWIPTECRDKHAFALRLEGDSMKATNQGLSFDDGDLIIAMPSEEWYSGCFAICRFTDHGVVFRRIEKSSGGSISLVPLNERYPIEQHALSAFDKIIPVWGRWTQLWKR